MKNKALFLVSLFYLFTANQAFSQLTCIYDKYHNRGVSGNAERDALVDSACVEINKGRLDVAYRMLQRIVEIDSLATGEPDAYFDSQREIVLEHLTSTKEALDKKYAPAPEPVSNVASTETKAKEEVKEEPEPAAGKEEKPVVVNETKTSVDVEREEPAKEEKKEEPAKTEEETKPAESVNSESKETEETPVQENTTESKVEINQSQEVAEKTEPEIKEEKSNTEEKVPDPGQTESEPQVTQVPPVEKIETNEEMVEKTFTEEELNGFQDKGFQKVRLLEGYIKQIVNKSTPTSLASDATENALILFDDPENRTVQVSSINKTPIPKYKVRKYLDRLRMLNYDKVDIEWADFQYTSEFRYVGDGIWHGYLVFRQRFVALKSDLAYYQDITTKKTLIILKQYKKAVDGVETDNWDVFLGDISVEQTASN